MRCILIACGLVTFGAATLRAQAPVATPAPQALTATPVVTLPPQTVARIKLEAQRLHNATRRAQAAARRSSSSRPAAAASATRGDTSGAFAFQPRPPKANQ